MTGCYHKFAYIIKKKKYYGKNHLKCLSCNNIIRPSVVHNYFTNGKTYYGKPIFIKCVKNHTSKKKEEVKK